MQQTDELSAYIHPAIMKHQTDEGGADATVPPNGLLHLLPHLVLHFVLVVPAGNRLSAEECEQHEHEGGSGGGELRHFDQRSTRSDPQWQAPDGFVHVVVWLLLLCAGKLTRSRAIYTLLGAARAR
jgi:hypothetical protein